MHEVAGFGLFLVTRHDLVLEVLRDPRDVLQRLRPDVDAAAVRGPRADDRRRRRGLPAGADDADRRPAGAHPLPAAGDQGVHAQGRSPRWSRRSGRSPCDCSIACVADAARSSSSRTSPCRCRSRSSPRCSTCPTTASPTSSAGRTTRSPASAPTLGIDGRLAAERGVNEFQHYFAEQLEQRRPTPQRRPPDRPAQRPRRRRRRTSTDTRPLDVPEMLSIIQQLLVAGNETTTKMLTEMMRLLGRAPRRVAARCSDDPGRDRARRRGDAAAVDADAGDVPHRHP